MTPELKPYDPNSNDWLIWGRGFYRQAFLQEKMPFGYAVHVFSTDEQPVHRLTKQFRDKNEAGDFLARIIKFDPARNHHLTSEP
jgi:hypothetical protein